jgi:LPXTG-site transpeptidase (sortase) family protein
VTSSAYIQFPARLPRTGFAPGIVTLLPEMPEGFSYTALGDFWVEIPRLGVNMNIVGVPFGDDSNWNLTWLGRDAGWLEGSAYPTHAGNSALTAHAYLPNGQPGPFAKLGDLSYGDQIIVHLAGEKYIYEVRENSRVRPTSLTILEHEDYPWLTLITCKAFNPFSDDYTYRIAVRAVQVDVESE